MAWLLMTLKSKTSNLTCALLPAATWTSLHPFFTFFPCWKFISVSSPHQSGHNLPPPHYWRDLPFPSEVVLDHLLHHLHPHFSPCPPARSTAAASPPPSASYSQSWHKQPTESDKSSSWTNHSPDHQLHPLFQIFHSLCAQAVSPAHCLSISMEEYFERVYLGSGLWVMFWSLWRQSPV